MDFLIQILSKCERSNNASHAKKINTSQNLSRLNLSAYNYFIANFGNNKHEIIRKVMILFQLYGLSKLLCDPLPYLKTKKNDLITTYAKRGTTTVHYLKLICDRRCATMSFVYFLNVWVINLDRKGYWITESEWKIVHCLTHYFRCVVSRPFVLQFAKKFFVELLLFKF